MKSMNEDKELDDILKERLQELPKAVRDSITSVEVEKKLQELAEHHKLHLDKWDALENEVMLTLIGLEPIAKLAENIKNELDVSQETANALTEDISTAIFVPIREELQRELPPEETAGVDADVVSDTHDTPYTIPDTISSPPPPIPSTPPPPPKTERAVRAPISESYMSQTPSHERKAIDGDPYRESIA